MATLSKFSVSARGLIVEAMEKQITETRKDIQEKNNLPSDAIILNKIDNTNFYDWANCYNDIYVKKSNLFFHMHRDSITITNLENALKRGKTCTQYSIQLSNWDDKGKIPPSNCIGTNLKDFFMFLEGLDFSKSGYDGLKFTTNNTDFKVYKHDADAKRTFSPFNINQLKPLKEMPKKWTLSHFYRLIANNQYKNLRCTGHYTDDYAFDASNNYGIKVIDNGLNILTDILSNPSGWRVYTPDNNKTLDIHCHTFLGYELEPVIN